MPSALPGMVRALEKVTGGIGFLAAMLVVPLIFATCYEVFARYIFGAPTVWAFELGYTVTGCHFLLGSALTLKMQGHIRIDLIYAHLSGRAQAAIDLFFYVCLFLPFLVLLSNGLLEYAVRAFESGERSGQSAWNPPIWPFRILIFTGFALLTLQVIAEVLKAAMTIIRREPEQGERR